MKVLHSSSSVLALCTYQRLSGLLKYVNRKKIGLISPNRPKPASAAKPHYLLLLASSSLHSPGVAVFVHISVFIGECYEIVENSIDAKNHTNCALLLTFCKENVLDSQCFFFPRLDFSFCAPFVILLLWYFFSGLKNWKSSSIRGINDVGCETWIYGAALVLNFVLTFASKSIPCICPNDFVP